ncbi:MAG: DUF853 family protein, partial [Flavobacteriales bacterium]|jgi:hypothetical protein|nr:DUF853 family protein [Flavobacteriales bacterium]
LVTALNDKGAPTPLAHTLVRAPITRMDILTPAEIDALVAQSTMAGKYNEAIDPESAYEILERRLAERLKNEADDRAEPAKPARGRAKKEPPGTLEKMSKNTMVRQLGNTVMREFARGLLGVLGVKAVRSKTAKR